jgi:hypothetical protein
VRHLYPFPVNDKQSAEQIFYLFRVNNTVFLLGEPGVVIQSLD